MQLEIIPGVGIGPICRGMSPADVRAVFPEEQRYETWMGGNLNDSLFFHGLICRFDKCNSRGPLPDAKLELIVVHQREDAILSGKPLTSWNKDSISNQLRDDGYAIEEMISGDLGIRGKLELSFARGGALDWVEIYVY